VVVAVGKDRAGDRLVTFYASPDLIRQFDEVAVSMGRSRASALRRLMEQAVAGGGPR
jgi:predicted transcriptional regulator